MSDQRTYVVIQFDETKPHWAKDLVPRAEALGLKDAKLGGDYDRKEALIYGYITGSLEDFRTACEATLGLHEGTVSETYAPKEGKAHRRDVEDALEIGTPYEPDCDICSACGEHAGFTEEYGSDCCNAHPYDTDVPDRDWEDV